MDGNYFKLSRIDGIVELYPMDELTGQWIYNRLANKDHLWIPGSFRVPEPLILISPWRDKGFKRFNDMAINILGFIPFGFLSLAHFSSIQRSYYSSAKSFLIVVLLGSLLSLIIELLQIYLPTRYSSSTDLICNIFGTSAGAFLYQFVFKK
jgi:glycopeptide antibiotics resistance protein